MPFLLTPHQIEASPKEVQIVFGGRYIAKTSSALLVWETAKSRPHYYLPLASLNQENAQIEALSAQGAENKNENEDDEGVERFKLTAGGKETIFSKAREGSGRLANFIRFEFSEIDAWLESGSLITCPPKSPSRRIDTAPLAHPIRVLINDTVIASCQAGAVVLYESAFPPRYYLPATSILDWGLLRESETRTFCPYKGEARYWSVDLGEGKGKGKGLWEDVIWSYVFPVGESGSIAGRFAFVEQEGVRVIVGEEEERSVK